MPPRRSSRSTRASVEPASVGTTGPAKRKRTQPTDGEILIEEKENIAKPQSRTRRASSTRSSVGPSSKSRPSTRTKAALQEVPESDEDEHASEDTHTPPVKKPRPSPDAENSDEEEQVEETKQRQRKSIPTPKKPSVSKKAARDEIDMDVEAGEVSHEIQATSRKLPVKRANNASAASTSRPSTTRPSSRATRASSKSTHVKSEEEPSQVVNDSSEDEPGGSVKAALKGRKSSIKPSRPSSRKTPNQPVPSPVASDHDQQSHEDISDEEEPTLNTRKRKADVSGTTTPPPPVDDESAAAEDEQSLLEPQSVNVPLSQVQPPLAEPEGPKSRLVIHKMALVNFKSYAGRQEIGPFHKVRSHADFSGFR